MGVPISSLPAASALTGAELLPVVQSGQTKRTTTDAIPYVPAGTGAVATTVQNKLRESVSVFDFMTAAQIADVQSGAASLDVAAAIQAALNSGDGLHPQDVLFPAGVYKITSTIVLPNNSPIRIYGEGNRSQRSSTGSGCTVLKFSGTGFCLTYNVGAVSMGFRGCKIENLHIQGSGTNPQGGVWLGNVANCLIRDVTVSNIMRADLTGTGFKFGDTETIGAQYNTLDNVCASSVDIGLDNVNTNGLRVIGGLFEDLTDAPRAGTIGIRFQSGGEGCLIGTVVQGWDTLVSLDGEFISCTAVRCEGFITAAYNIKGRSNSVIGGSISNFIAGGGGVGVIVDAAAFATMLIIPDTTSVATVVSDSGSKTTIINQEKLVSRSGLFTPNATNQNALVAKALADQASLIFTVQDSSGANFVYVDQAFETTLYFPGYGTRKVSVGGFDSAGTGYRLLRVQN